jgi:hypothetical protein
MKWFRKEGNSFDVPRILSGSNVSNPRVKKIV